jgi:hypothetical protein
VGVLYLGADVPVTSWVHVVRQHGSRVAVIGVVQRADQAMTMRVAEALARSGATALLAVGGRHARWDGALEAGIVVLPERIIDAADVVARLTRGTDAMTQTRRAER